MTQDEILIQEIVKRLEAAWNAGDSAAFCASFAEDIDFIDVLGNHHKGRAAVEQGHGQIFATFYKGSQNHYTMESIRFLRPDIAIAFVHSRVKSRLTVSVDSPNRAANVGDTWREDQTKPTVILAKENGNWLVVAFQNTRVAGAGA